MKHILFAITAMILISCNENEKGGDSSKQAQISENIPTDDSLKLNAWKKLFTDSPNKSPKAINDAPVKDNKLARECIDEYKRQYKTSPGTIKFTEWIGFSGKLLGDWITSISNGSTDYNTMRIELGVYTPAFCQAHNIPKEKIGKLTAFLWPYNNATPAQTTTASRTNSPTEVFAFNLGELHP